MPLSLTEASALHLCWGLQARWAGGPKAALLLHWPRAFSKKLAHSPKLCTPAAFATRANPSSAVRALSHWGAVTHVAIARPLHQRLGSARLGDAVAVRCCTPSPWACRAAIDDAGDGAVQVHSHHPTATSPASAVSQRTHALRLARFLSHSHASPRRTALARTLIE